MNQDKVVCTETAIGALGKFALYQLDGNQEMRNQVLDKFLSCLPLKNESEEAQNVHKMLLEEYSKNNAILLSQKDKVI